MGQGMFLATGLVQFLTSPRWLTNITTKFNSTLPALMLSTSSTSSKFSPTKLMELYLLNGKKTMFWLRPSSLIKTPQLTMSSQLILRLGLTMSWWILLTNRTMLINGQYLMLMERKSMNYFSLKLRLEKERAYSLSNVPNQKETSMTSSARNSIPSPRKRNMKKSKVGALVASERLTSSTQEKTLLLNIWWCQHLRPLRKRTKPYSIDS